LSDDKKDMLIEKMSQRSAFLKELFRLGKHKFFASQNEAHPRQVNLFKEVKDIAELEFEPADIYYMMVTVFTTVLKTLRQCVVGHKPADDIMMP
jgi:hypothetical protein